MKNYLLYILIMLGLMACGPVDVNLHMDGGTENTVKIINCVNPETPEQALLCEGDNTDINCDAPANPIEELVCAQLRSQ